MDEGEFINDVKINLLVERFLSCFNRLTVSETHHPFSETHHIFTQTHPLCNETFHLFYEPHYIFLKLITPLIGCVEILTKYVGMFPQEM